MKWLLKRLEEDTAFHTFLPMILEEPSTHADFIKEVEETRLRAIEILEDPEFSQRAFFDKFQESFSFTAEHVDDTNKT